MSDHKYTDFGFKKVLFNQKQSLVDRVFSDVADKYDIMNDVMSLGMHRLWKKVFLGKIKDFSGMLLDLAAGSGDISLNYYQKASSGLDDYQIFLCDINPDMINRARNKFIDNNILESVNFIVGDGVALPFADEKFDTVTIAFGIRNIPDIMRSLYEIKRVLKKGGQFLCLEFSNVENDVLSKIYDLYSFNIIPKIGKLIANNEDAYQYLVESIKQFPSQEKFASMIKDVGFKGVNYESLTSGIVAIHQGYNL
jgi:demethylmenaquinone methyltransferase / 2-methoxy-6-polyprenyl-1,4-benzoquinol methylase